MCSGPCPFPWPHLVPLPSHCMVATHRLAPACQPLHLASLCLESSSPCLSPDWFLLAVFMLQCHFPRTALHDPQFSSGNAVLWHINLPHNTRLADTFHGDSFAHWPSPPSKMLSSTRARTLSALSLCIPRAYNSAWHRADVQ